MSDKKTPPKTEKDSESTDIEPNIEEVESSNVCLLYTSPSPRDGLLSRMPSSA